MAKPTVLDLNLDNLVLEGELVYLKDKSRSWTQAEVTDALEKRAFIRGLVTSTLSAYAARGVFLERLELEKIWKGCATVWDCKPSGM